MGSGNQRYGCAEPRRQVLTREKTKRYQAVYQELVAKLEARTIRTELRGIRLHQTLSTLAKELEIKVYPSEKAWNADPRISFRTAGRTLGEFNKQLRRRGIRTIVAAKDPSMGHEENALFLFKR